MKRTLQFKKSEDEFVFFEEDEVVFAIPDKSLEFNIKNFYDAFYSDEKYMDELIIENMVPDDKEGCRILACVEELIKKINEKINSAIGKENSEIVKD